LVLKAGFVARLFFAPKSTVQRRVPIGIHTLQIGSFSAILHQKTMAGVSLAMVFYLVLLKNLSLWSASQF